MIRRHVGKHVQVTFDEQPVIAGWLSIQVDITNQKWLLRCYCHGNEEHNRLELGQGTLTIEEKNGIRYVYSATLTRIAEPYTFDDAVVYEYQGALEGTLR